MTVAAMNTAARFITFEGIEGVGKTTQVTRLSTALNLRGIAHVVTREPGGTPLAESIRQVVLTAREEPLPPTAELLLMFAARAVHLANHIEPNLHAGRWVICDRFTDATLRLSRRRTAVERRPHPRIGTHGARNAASGSDHLARRAGATRHGARRCAQLAGTVPDRFENERSEFFERVRGVYRARAAAEPKRIVVVDATLPIEEVGARILEELKVRSWIS